MIAMQSSNLSIEATFAGRAVLLTGGLGFLGSCVLEQLLRKTQVETIYLLVRGKRHATPTQRIGKLLCAPLFHLLHKQVAAGGPNVFDKVRAVAGDLCAPGLGLSASDAEEIKASVDFVIHCAANVTLDADVQATFRDNYLSTEALMSLSSQMINLRAFVHISTYFVNNNLPRNSLVREKIYPLDLQLRGKPVNHQELVSAVMSMEPAAANQAIAQLMQDLNFTSTYAFGKHLTEQLVEGTCIKPGVAKAIVRPSLIAGMAGAPYPGWISGYAGPPGYTMAYALGFFQGTAGIAYASDLIMDLIPCDTVSTMILAVTAATAQQSHQHKNCHQIAAIYHSCSSESHPIKLPEVFDVMYHFWQHNPPQLKLPTTGYTRVKGPHHPTATTVQQARRLAARKVKLLSFLLRCSGKAKVANLLQKSFQAFCVQNSRAYDRSMICSVDNGRALLAALPAEEQKVWPIIWEPSQMSWEAYSRTFQAAVRGLLFKMPDQTKAIEHSFVFHAAADLSVITGPVPVRAASSISWSGSEAATDVVDSISEKREAVDVEVQIDSSVEGDSNSCSPKNLKDVDDLPVGGYIADIQSKRAFKPVSCFNFKAWL